MSIQNFGTPIPAENQKIMFHPWMRGADKNAGQNAHLGLGLYVAKLIVEAHGGEIAVVSGEERGTTFTLQLPRA